MNRGPLDTPRKPSLPVEVGRTLGAWIAGQVKICAILAVIYSAGFAISRVPWSFVVGPVCGALNIIPMAGPFIALLLALGVAYLGTLDIYAPLGALVTFVVAQALEGFYLTPKILGTRLRIPPVAVFLAILIGGALFGVLGVLFAAPALAIVALVWRRSEGR